MIMKKNNKKEEFMQYNTAELVIYICTSDLRRELDLKFHTLVLMPNRQYIGEP